MASSGPSSSPCLDGVGLIAGAVLAAELLGAGEDAAETVAGVQPGLERAPSPCSANSSGKNACTAWPKMIGSETFIIVAFRCTENSTPSALARAICVAQERLQRGGVHEGGVDDLAGLDRHGLLEHLVVPSAATSSMRSVPSFSITDRLLVGAEVVGVHVRDVGLRVGLHSPIECGCLRA